MKYVALGDATQHLQGRFIGFVGDRTSTKEQTAIVLPSMKTWTWETKRVRNNALHMTEYYEQDTTRRGKLWQPLPVESEDEGSDLTAPLLLALPNILFQAMRKEGKPLMPHEIGIIAAKQFCNEDNNTEWKLILDWCLLAAQADEKGTSWLGLQVEAATEGDDDYFAKWIAISISSPLRCHLPPTTPPLHQPPPPPPPLLAASTRRKRRGRGFGGGTRWRAGRGPIGRLACACWSAPPPTSLSTVQR